MTCIILAQNWRSKCRLGTLVQVSRRRVPHEEVHHELKLQSFHCDLAEWRLDTKLLRVKIMVLTLFLILTLFTQRSGGAACRVKLQP